MMTDPNFLHAGIERWRDKGGNEGELISLDANTFSLLFVFPSQVITSIWVQG